MFRKKKLENFFKNNFSNLIIFEKNSVEIQLIFEEKVEKNVENNFSNFFIFEKKSVKRRLKVG